LAKAHQLPMVSIEDLIRDRLIHQPMVSIQATAQLPIEPWGEFQIQVFSIDGREHVALTKPMSDSSAPALVRLHSSCLTGDVFGSMRCDCGPQLHIALGRIADNGGAILYMQQEGRGIGLVNKIKAYALQEQGMDTVEANQNLGFLPDQRQYLRAAEILSVLDMRRIRLLTNNPTKVAGLQQWGIDVVERVPIMIKPNHHNVNYLQTKQKKLGHLLGEMA
jgi:3,4-dihydroxy 2-butanone 4-phosphate synthase/GTP cyclohydrolase II